MFLQIHEIIENTKVEGPGNRTCIFVQGCLQHCDGCNSPDTWDIIGGKKYSVEELSKKILSNNTIEGVTFSGGEPFLQSKALYELALILKKHDLTIVTFTGYSYEYIEELNDASWNRLLSVTDILISEPFEIDNVTYDKIWVGSSNQEYHFLSDRYLDYKDRLKMLENKIEIRLKKDGSIIVNGIASTEKIHEMFKKI